MFLSVWLENVEVQLTGSVPYECHRELFVRVVDSYGGESVDYVSESSWGCYKIGTVIHLTGGVSRANWISDWRKRTWIQVSPGFDR